MAIQSLVETLQTFLWFYRRLSSLATTLAKTGERSVWGACTWTSYSGAPVALEGLSHDHPSAPSLCHHVRLECRFPVMEAEPTVFPVPPPVAVVVAVATSPATFIAHLRYFVGFQFIIIFLWQGVGVVVREWMARALQHLGGQPAKPPSTPYCL